jgi:tetraacyldisaccharide 4'-kinase
VNLLVAVYGAVTGARNRLYEGQVLPVRRLARPVISVGNLSVGGSGKTPFVILLGEMLKERGVPFDVLSRGYGRQTRGVLQVDPEGSPREFGDEPLLIARRLRVPVFLGEDRFAAGQFAERKFGPQLHLLDDGFQHRALARDFDIVLVTPDDARDRLLPAGRLREPLTSLRRADAVVLTSGASPSAFPAEGKLVWRVWRGIKIPTRASLGGAPALGAAPRGESGVPPRPVAFCGIARPQNFLRQLRTAGIEPAAEAIYRDHHAYSEKDIHELLALKAQSEAGGFVTTEKDAVNLSHHVEALQPLAVIPVKMELEDAANAVSTMLGIVDERRHRS